MSSARTRPRVDPQPPTSGPAGACARGRAEADRACAGHARGGQRGQDRPRPAADRHRRAAPTAVRAGRWSPPATRQCPGSGVRHRTPASRAVRRARVTDLPPGNPADAVRPPICSTSSVTEPTTRAGSTADRQSTRPAQPPASISTVSRPASTPATTSTSTRVPTRTVPAACAPITRSAPRSSSGFGLPTT